MIVADPGSRRRYILKDERSLPAEQQSIFLLRPLTLKESNRLEDMGVSANSEAEFHVKSGSVKTEALRMGLVGWENVKNRADQEIEFKGTKQKRNGEEFIQPDDATIMLIPPMYRAELAEEITNGSGVDEEEAKNFSGSESEPSADTP